MSTRAKLTLSAAALFSSFTVWFVHANQNAEREAMYRGVLRDEARQAAKRVAREEELRHSILKRQRYEAVQQIASSGRTGQPSDHLAS